MTDSPDFDRLMYLSDHDPAGFFAERSRLIESFLASVPPERRDQLRRFQAEIDAVRASAGTPQNAVSSLMGMLTDHLESLLGHTRQLAVEARTLRAERPAGRCS
ncbi:MAG: DUF3135 domain-containing protein [Burkholderiales bacterium]|nr:DUF3135 domain-containing protein [Burkholderiales bacterium]